MQILYQNLRPKLWWIKLLAMTTTYRKKITHIFQSDKNIQLWFCETWRKYNETGFSSTNWLSVLLFLSHTQSHTGCLSDEISFCHLPCCATRCISPTNASATAAVLSLSVLSLKATAGSVLFGCARQRRRRTWPLHYKWLHSSSLSDPPTHKFVRVRATTLSLLHLTAACNSHPSRLERERSYNGVSLKKEIL